MSTSYFEEALITFQRIDFEFVSDKRAKADLQEVHHLADTFTVAPMSFSPADFAAGMGSSVTMDSSTLH